MSIGEFAVAVALLRRRHGGWVTSWGRTDQHSVEVGGFASDPHTWDRGVDLLFHVPPDLGILQQDAAEFGLRVIKETEKPHYHVQPIDFPAGPVTRYDGSEKTWA